jgi:glutathione S-transferase
MPLADLEPQGEAKVEAWKKVQAAFDTIHGWLDKSSGPYFMGDKVTFSDFVVAGMLDGIRLCFGEESEEWRNLQTWNGGKWKLFLESLKQYANCDN